MSRRHVPRPLWAIFVVAAVASCSTSPSKQVEEPAGAPRAADHFLDAQLVVDRTGYAYLAAIERDVLNDRIFVSASTNSGEAWRPPARLAETVPGGRRVPRLATGGSREIYVAWADARAGAVDVYFNCSLDGGETWRPQDVQINTNVAAGSHIASPAIAADDHGNVYIVWMDDREGFDAFYCNRSRDFGRTWLQVDRRVTQLGFGRKGLPRLACDWNGTVHVVWVEERNGRRGLYANVSPDHGDTWSLTDATLSDATETLTPEVGALEGGIVVVTWLESLRTGGVVQVVRSTDGGRSWSLPRALGGQGADWVSTPRLALVRPAHAYVAWHEQGRVGESAIVLQSSADAAGRFAGTLMTYPMGRGPLPLDPATAGRTAPFTMSADLGGNVYFAYVENQPGQWTVGFDRVADYGRNWMRLQPQLELSVPVTIAIAAGLPRGALPMVGNDELGHVCVLWNTGDLLWVAASPFNGDAGWRRTTF